MAGAAPVGVAVGGAAAAAAVKSGFRRLRRRAVAAAVGAAAVGAAAVGAAPAGAAAVGVVAVGEAAAGNLWISPLIRWFDDRPGMPTGTAIVGFASALFVAAVAELAELASHSSAATEWYGALVRCPPSDGRNFVSDRQPAMRRRERFQH